MKILFTVALSFAVFFCSLLFLASSYCAAIPSFAPKDRGLCALIAVITLALDVGAILLIAKINRLKQ